MRATSVLVVESIGKVTKLQGFLDRLYGPRAFVVAATGGHFRGLPDMDGNALSDVIDLASFEERHVVHKREVRTRLAGVFRDASAILLATDADREGEAIAWHIVQEFGLDARSVKRVRFIEITEAALKRAIEHPAPLDLLLVDAQRSRQLLDYALGLELSRRLWRFGGRSAGRVQSAAVRIVVDRENAIRSFQPESFVTLQAHYTGGFSAVLKAPSAGVVVDGGVGTDDDGDGDGDEREGESDAKRRFTVRRFSDARDAKRIADLARTRRHVVEGVENASITRRPPPPFTTASLQATAATSLSFDARKTARLAQELFERGLVTYIRTDSTALSTEAIDDIRAELRRRFPRLLPDQPQRYADRKGAQGAHEAIRPVLMQNPEAASLGGEARALYDLIWWRALACQAQSAMLRRTTVTIAVDGLGEDRFVGEATVVLTPGFLAIADATAEPPRVVGLPAHLARGAALRVKQIEERGGATTPPKRFTEATLTTYIEKRGIGRPATYASTLSTIVERGYVEKRKGHLVPTEHGLLTDSLLRTCFDTLTREEFTASCEKNFDAIADGKVSRVAFLRKFHDGFVRLLDHAAPKLDAFGKAHPLLDRVAVVVDTIACARCGGVRHIQSRRHGRVATCQQCNDAVLIEARVLSKSDCHRDPTHGKMAALFVATKGKSARHFRCLLCGYKATQEAAPPPCPLCQAPMRMLDGPRGAFWGCTAFQQTGCRGSAAVEPVHGRKNRQPPPATRRRKRAAGQEKSA